MIYEILLWEFVFAIKIKLYKNYQKWFYFTKKAPFILKFFKFLYFPLPLFLPFLVIANFIEKSSYMISSKIYGLIMSLNWILKTTDSLISGEVKFWSWYLFMDKFGCLNHFTLSYMIKRSLRAWKWGLVAGEERGELNVRPNFQKDGGLDRI